MCVKGYSIDFSLASKIKQKCLRSTAMIPMIIDTSCHDNTRSVCLIICLIIRVLLRYSH